ncbi:MAG: GIY-YIG nuclease family protein [Betaproteobacteria bacterium]
MATEPLTATTYQLFIEVSVPVRVSVGRLGCFDFPAGEYVYTGSARRNFSARVNRHLSPIKKMHWHIDYLLTTPGVNVREVLCYAEPECAVNQQTRGEILVPGFGSSDCLAGCGSHLKRLESPRSV